jgi:integrase/recombinase XerD
MLTLYRRHRKGCEHRRDGREWRRCRCPIWVDGFVGGREVRQSLKESNWERATETIQKWEARGFVGDGQETEHIPIEQAAKDFTADAEARKLKDRTIYKYKLLFGQLSAFAQEHGFRFLEELDTPALRKFRASWKDANLAALKKLERLRSFFRFAHENGWIAGNPLAGIKNPKVTMRPTLPFSRDEMIAILERAQKNIGKVQQHGRDNARRLRALILLLRYTGLRIGDAVSCSVDRLADGKLRLYTQKTGTHVHCPLPEFVVRELDAIPKMSEKYWFWTGNGKLQTAVADWQGRLADLFSDKIENRKADRRKSAAAKSEQAKPDVAEVAETKPKNKLSEGHAHRFRDTFAVELLLAGVPLERVSILLGHQSVKITEKHYSPWIRERQEQAEADVRRTWTQDPIALMQPPVPETKGTPEVHRKPPVVN